MKKLLTILFALCIAISVTACDTNNAQPQKETSNNNKIDTASQSEDKSYGLNDSATFKNLKITATKLEESTGKNFFNAESGNVFVGVNFEIENISDEPQSISSLLLFDAYANDVKCEYSFSANAVFGNGTLDGEISPGKKLVGWYAVEIPQNWETLEFEVKSDWLSDDKAKFVFNK